LLSLTNYKARPKTAKKPKARPAVPKSFATLRAAAAALEVVLAVALPVDVPELVAVLDAVVEDAELADAEAA